MRNILTLTLALLGTSVMSQQGMPSGHYIDTFYEDVVAGERTLETQEQTLIFDLYRAFQADLDEIANSRTSGPFPPKLRITHHPNMPPFWLTDRRGEYVTAFAEKIEYGGVPFETHAEMLVYSLHKAVEPILDHGPLSVEKAAVERMIEDYLKYNPVQIWVDEGENLYESTYLSLILNGHDDVRDQEMAIAHMSEQIRKLTAEKYALERRLADLETAWAGLEDGLILLTELKAVLTQKK